MNNKILITIILITLSFGGISSYFIYHNKNKVVSPQTSPLPKETKRENKNNQKPSKDNNNQETKKDNDIKPKKEEENKKPKKEEKETSKENQEAKEPWFISWRGALLLEILFVIAFEITKGIARSLTQKNKLIKEYCEGINNFDEKYKKIKENSENFSNELRVLKNKRDSITEVCNRLIFYENISFVSLAILSFLLTFFLTFFKSNKRFIWRLLTVLTNIITSLIILFFYMVLIDDCLKEPYKKIMAKMNIEDKCISDEIDDKLRKYINILSSFKNTNVNTEKPNECSNKN